MEDKLTELLRNLQSALDMAAELAEQAIALAEEECERLSAASGEPDEDRLEALDDLIGELDEIVNQTVDAADTVEAEIGVFGEPEEN